MVRQNGLLNEKSVNSPNSDYQITKLRIENELKKNLSKKINLITCGGQSTIPVINELKKTYKNSQTKHFF